VTPDNERKKIDLNEVNSCLHENIPMTAAMAAEVAFYDGRQVTVCVPLRPNRNHSHTAFGGSLAALGIVAGWVLLYLKLKEEGLGFSLVIGRSSFDFLAPVESDFNATCQLPPGWEWRGFLRSLKRRGRARITLQAEIKDSSAVAGRHKGFYVAVLNDEKLSG
jgi:thioesterase domain-containing protein